jgi:UDP-glucose 4-epimerase
LFEDKTLLITCGICSFGNAALDRSLDTDISEIRIFSRDEKKQDYIRKAFNHPKLIFYIEDVRDRKSLDNATVGVDFIFHAGALKQVASCEFFPIEAFKTNILGAENVLASAVQHNVKKVVILSTDKAVYPVNAMDMSRAMMEKVMAVRSRNIPEGGTVMCGTRYGKLAGLLMFDPFGLSAFCNGIWQSCAEQILTFLADIHQNLIKQENSCVV